MADAPAPPQIIVGSGDPGDGSGGGGTGGDGTGGDGGSTGIPPAGSTPVLGAFVIDSRRVRLAWNDSYTDEEGYRVEYSLTGQPNSFQQLWDSFAPNATLYEAKDLPSGTKIWFRVVGYKGNGVGHYSNVVAATTKGAPSFGGSGGGGGTGGGTHTQSFNGGSTVGGSTVGGGSVLPGLDPFNNDNTGNPFGDNLITL